jgi:hypothetical protein
MPRFFYIAILLVLSGCTSSIRPHSEPPSYVLTPSIQSEVIEQFNNNLPNDDKNTSWFSLLNTGQESLARRIVVVKY